MRIRVVHFEASPARAKELLPMAMEKKSAPAKTPIGPDEEAAYLQGLYDGKLSSCLEFTRQHFSVIQTRSQLLLTICALALTITGFSGLKIVQTNLFARYSMVLGIVFVLATMLILLVGGFKNDALEFPDGH